MPRYDAAIVGAGFLGLGIAALLCKRDKRVVIIDPAPEPGGMSADLLWEDMRVGAAPEALFGFEENGPLRALCSEVGIQLNLMRGAASYQVLLPDHRITVSSERDQTLSELRREFPQQIDGLVRMYRELDAVTERSKKGGLSAYFVRRRPALEFLGSYGLGREISAFFHVQSMAYFGLPLSRLRLVDLAILTGLLPQRPVTGISGIMDDLRKFIVGRGGDLRTGEPWPEILHRSGRTVGVRTMSGDIEARMIVANRADVDQERRLVLTVRSEVIPVSMGNSLLWLPAYDAPNTIFALSISNMAKAPESFCSLGITLYGPSSAITADGFVDRTGEIIPFLRDFIVTGGEVDLAARRCPLEGMQVAGRSRTGNEAERSVLRLGRSFYSIPDSHAGLGRLLQDSLHTIKGLS